MNNNDARRLEPLFYVTSHEIFTDIDTEDNLIYSITTEDGSLIAEIIVNDRPVTNKVYTMDLLEILRDRYMINFKEHPNDRYARKALCAIEDAICLMIDGALAEAKKETQND